LQKLAVSIAVGAAACSIFVAACGSDDTQVGATAPANGGDAGATSDASTAASTDASVDKSDAGISTGDAGPTCGLRSGKRGLTSRTVSVGGANRTYLIYLPATADASKPLPFVFVFHGYLMSGQQMHDITQYAALADTEGIALAFPDGEGGPDSVIAPWNVASATQNVCGDVKSFIATGDDFAFMDAMKADVLEDQCIDNAHVFATGFSMGAYFTHHIGCERSDIRAVAPHSGGMLADLSSCTTGHVPIILFHGTADDTVPDGCDDPNSFAQPGFPASAKLWAAKNGCQTTYKTTTENGSAGNGQCYVYDGCPADGQVELCTFTGMNHCWAGGSASGQGATSACPTWANATQLEWNFFKKYAW
jgi:polyhydroxybutyrate depolymerase